MYEVESPRSGFLSFGKLTARVEAKKGTGPIGRNGPPPASGYSAAHRLDLSPFSPHGSGAKGERTANLALLEEESGPTTSLAPRPSTLVSKHDPQSTTGYPPFSVRTPTAIVTDLGTEFGVEVEPFGRQPNTRFPGQGRVRRDVNQQGGSAIVLGVGETARAEPTNANHVKVIRVRSNASAFVRELPRPAPVRVFSTGVGLKPGDADPHWQIVAFSGDPTFKPQAAFVVDLRPVSVKGLTLPYQPNDPTRSQWLSTVSAMPALPRGTFTFRTTFEIGNVRPETVVLLGRFIVDNHVERHPAQRPRCASPATRGCSSIRPILPVHDQYGSCQRNQCFGDRRVQPSIVARGTHADGAERGIGGAHVTVERPTPQTSPNREGQPGK